MTMFKHTPPGNVDAMTYKELDQLMTKVITEAVRGTKNVCSREHIKGVERHERVSEFVTQLRRGISRYFINGVIGKHLVDNLCKKDVWYDAGQVSTNSRINIRISWQHGAQVVDFGRVQGWCYMATGTYRPEEDLAAEIDQDLERMALDLKALGMKSQEMDQINRQAAEVSDELVKIMEPLTE